MLDRLLPGLIRNVSFTVFYYLVVVLSFWALWLWWRRHPTARKRLHARSVRAPQIRREMLLTVSTLMLAGSVMPILLIFGFGKHTQFYPKVAKFGWAYFVLSIFLMMLVQDTYFYWSHRLMHHRRLFRWFHRTHHQSISTNPWTTYSVGPLEALAANGVSILILMLIPVTGLALFIFSWINTTYAVYTHLGYELYPRGMESHWLGRWINTSVAHNTHHARNRYNYGWYFLCWDRAMGTLDPDYAERFRAARGE